MLEVQVVPRGHLVGAQHAPASVVVSSGSEVVMPATLPDVLTSVDALTIINMTRSNDMNGAHIMSENTELREQVRARYAHAATAVKSGTRNADLLVEDACCGTSCCGGQPADRDTTRPASEGSCCGDTTPAERGFGAGLYDLNDADGLPIEAIEASLGCGNPTAVAELRAGERVLDLGSGGGIDVLLSAKRVGPTGFAFGVDMTDEMLE